MKTQDSIVIAEHERNAAGLVGLRLGWLALAGLVLAALIPRHVWQPFSSGHSLEEALTEMDGPVELDWLARFQGGGPRMPRASAVAFSGDGSRVFVTGLADTRRRGYERTTIAYDRESGRPEWTAREPGPDNLFAAGHLVVCTDTEQLYLSGWNNDASGGGANLTSYLAADGTRLWSVGFEKGVGSRALHFVVCPSRGRLYLSSQSALPSGRAAARLAGLDSHTGELLWERQRTVPESTVLHDTVVTLDPETGTLFIGDLFVNGSPGVKWRISSYDAATGTEQWTVKHSLPFQDQLRDLTLTTAGSRLYMSGTAAGRNADPAGYILLCLNARTGDVEWTTIERDRLQSAVSFYLREATACILIVGTAQKRQGGWERIGLITAFDAASGRHLWSREVTSLGQVQSSILAAEKELLVVVGSRPKGLRQPAVFAVDLNHGAVHWTAEYAATDSRGGIGKALALSPDGHTVAVAGISSRTGSGGYSTAVLRTLSEAAGDEEDLSR